ncbi:MAG: ABC transporter permease [Acidimicrobiales bacterium]
MPLASAGDPWVRWDWVSRHSADIAAAGRQHAELTAIAVALGLAISFPLALAARRWRRLEQPVMAGTGLLFAVPSLALFALLVPVYGLSRLTAEIGLVGYTFMILVRNILAGLDGVPAEVTEAARGLGYRPLRQLVTVEVPLALPVILAGVRLATVTTVGLVTVTGLIAQGGLGAFIIEGINRDFRTPVVVGSVLSVALAVVADLGLAAAGRLLTPWARSR